MSNDDTEQTLVRFFKAALGTSHDLAQDFARRIPPDMIPTILATAQTWAVKSAAIANMEFVKWVGLSPFMKPGETVMARMKEKVTEDAPVTASSLWTPERRAALSRKMKDRWNRMHGGATPARQAVAHDRSHR